MRRLIPRRAELRFSNSKVYDRPLHPHSGVRQLFSSTVQANLRIVHYKSFRNLPQQSRAGSNPHRVLYQKSTSPYTLIVAISVSAALALGYLPFEPTKNADTSKEEEAKSAPTLDEESLLSLDNPLASFFAAMPVSQGFLGNLTTEQEQRLRDFWALVLNTFKVPDPIAGSNLEARPATPSGASIKSVEDTSSKKKERHGLFHRKNKDSSNSDSPGSPGKGDPDDKYGQTKELQEILATTKPEVLREAFWSMVKKDHPDTLMLRFLRARKWDIQKALAMLISTMHWRKDEVHVDDDIMINGEGGALRDSQSSDANVKREGADFLAQLRIGKSFMHGMDKDGRPICLVRVRLHKSGEQSENALERYTVYVIETARLALIPPVETATIVFDMTNFTMANMDYTPVKFMIKVFEANYPESLGCVLVHKAPWIFQGIWKIIRGWLDPVVAAKVHFTNGVEDLSEFIPKSQIIKELGGQENWEYKYVEPTSGENRLMEDRGQRDQLEAQRRGVVQNYEQKTFEWIHGQNVKGQRDELAGRLRQNYWQLDPYIRARTLYDRTGMIKPDGTVNFYPSQTSKAENRLSGAPPRQEVRADDVD